MGSSPETHDDLNGRESLPLNRVSFKFKLPLLSDILICCILYQWYRSYNAIISFFELV